jgi:hypothetical protein
MRRLIPFVGILLLGACASLPPKEDPEERLQSVRVLGRAVEFGRIQGAADPSFVPALEEASLAWLLYRGPAPMAGARRLLDLREKRPELAAVFLDAPEAAGLSALTAKEEFRSGQFFNSYDPALFRPFYRRFLLSVLTEPPRDEAAWLALQKPLELAVGLTPRFAGVYPNQLAPELRLKLEAYVQAHPGPDADRFRMLALLDRRYGAWEAERLRLEAELRSLAETSRDELLKWEIKDALASPRARPDRAFWLSLLLPGLGQVSQGDVQGGVLLGGLTFAAWLWLGGKLVAAQGADEAGRRVAYGDAAWAASLALVGHTFTALNAAEQARFINIVVGWDLLSRDRLKPEDAP